MKDAFAVLILFLMLGCGGSKEVARVSETNTFHFDYDSKSYEVVSRRVRGDGVQNFLLRKDDREVVLRAVDADRNGWIEAVLLSSRDPVDVTSANKIYHAGIEEARNRGLLRESEMDSLNAGSRLVSVDFVPGRNGNVIDRRVDDPIRVAILGEVGFHIDSIDQSTLRLNDVIALLGPAQFGKFDVNADGIPDLVLDLPLTMIRVDQKEVALCVSGLFRGGLQFRGCETVEFK